MKKVTFSNKRVHWINWMMFSGSGCDNFRQKNKSRQKSKILTFCYSIKYPPPKKHHPTYPMKTSTLGVPPILPLIFKPKYRLFPLFSCSIPIQNFFPTLYLSNTMQHTRPFTSSYPDPFQIPFAKKPSFPTFYLSNAIQHTQTFTSSYPDPFQIPFAKTVFSNFLFFKHHPTHSKFYLILP